VYFLKLSLLSFEGYAIETFAEIDAIQDYWYKNDTTALQAIIQQNKQPSPEFRRFVADLVASKIKRPMKKRSTFDRDLQIYEEINEAVENGITKTAIKETIRKRLNKETSTIQKAYDRAEKSYKKYLDCQQEEEMENTK
jgi:hypothetical protein